MAMITGKGISFLMAIYLSYSYGMEFYGNYSYYLAICSMLSCIVIFSTPATLRNYFGRADIATPEIVGIVLYFAGVILSILILISVIFYNDTMMIFIYLCIAAYSMSVMNLLGNFSALRGDIKIRSILIISHSLLWFFVITFAGLKNPEEVLKFYVITSIPAIIICILFYRNIINWRISQYHRKALNIFRNSMPIIFQGLAIISINLVDRVIVAKVLGAETNGIYSLSYLLGTIPILAIMAIEPVYLKIFAHNVKAGLDNSAMYKSAIQVLLAIGSLNIATITILLNIIPTYLPDIRLDIVILTFAVCYFQLGYIFTSNEMFIIGRNKEILRITVFISAIGAVLSYFSIFILDVFGPIIFTALSFLAINLAYKKVINEEREKI